MDDIPQRAYVHTHGPSAWLASIVSHEEGPIVQASFEEASTVVHTVQHGQLTGRQGLDQSLEAFHRLIGDIRTSTNIDRLILITDFSGFNGQRFATTPWTSSRGASVRNEQGMSSLIAEVLAKSLINVGKDVVCIRCDHKGHPELMPTIKGALLATKETLRTMQNPDIPDLDGWLAVCLDSDGVHSGDLKPALLMNHTGS